MLKNVATVLLSIYPREALADMHKETNTNMFTVGFRDTESIDKRLIYSLNTGVKIVNSNSLLRGK